MADLRERPRALAPPASADAITVAALVRAFDALHANQIRMEHKIDLLLARRDSTLSRPDRARLVHLLPAVAGAIGSTLITSRELVAHPSPAVQIAVRGLSVKQLGRLLSRAEGVAIDGLVVERVGVEINVAVWKISAC